MRTHPLNRGMGPSRLEQFSLVGLLVQAIRTIYDITLGFPSGIHMDVVCWQTLRHHQTRLVCTATNRSLRLFLAASLHSANAAQGGHLALIKHAGGVHELARRHSYRPRCYNLRNLL